MSIGRLVFGVSLLVAAVARADVTAAPVGGPVVVVGMDGMTFDLADPLVAAGRMPNFASLLKRGARAVLNSERPMRSPALWTTLATGQPRHVHGIYDFVTGSSYWPRKNRGPKQRLVTSGMRQSPAVWQMASQHQKRSLVVGWLNTWPAEKIEGVMVAPYMALGERRQTSIKGRVYANAKGQVHPPSAAAWVAPQIVGAEAVPREILTQIVTPPPASSALFRAIPRLKRYLYTVRWSAGSALTNTGIVVEALQRRGPFDLVMTYVDGADTLAHRFWMMREPEAKLRTRMAAHGLDPTLAPALKKHFGQAVESFYVLFDVQLGRILKAAGPNATVVVLSDHGWGASGRRRALHATVPFDGEHRLEGLLVAAGPQIRAGRYRPLSLYEVAPTILYLLGLGVPPGLPGRVATELIAEDFLERHPPLLLAKKALPAKAAPDSAPDAPFEEQEIERLRSLGYVQ